MNVLHEPPAARRVFQVRKILTFAVLLMVSLAACSSQDNSNNAVEVEVDDSISLDLPTADTAVQSDSPSAAETYLAGACGTLDETRTYKGLVFKCIVDAENIQSKKNSWALISINKLTNAETLLLGCASPEKTRYVATKEVNGVAYTCTKVEGAYVWVANSQAALISLPSRGSAPSVSTTPSPTSTVLLTPITPEPNGDGGGQIALLAQSITFEKFPVIGTYGDTLLEVTATSNSGLAVSLSVSFESERICSVAPNGKVETLSSGVCTIVGSQSGSSVYASAFETRKSFTVSQRSITIAAVEKSKKYGLADPDLTYTVGGDGLVNSDVLSGALAHTSNGQAGTWAINQGNLDNSDYNITFTGATFTVDKLSITITATAATKEYSDADPALLYTVTGDSLATGDSVSGSLVHTGSLVGTFQIKVGSLGIAPVVNSDSYTIQYVSASMTITKKTRTGTLTMPNDLAGFKVGSTATATASIAIGDGQPIWSADGACSVVSSTGVITGNSAESCTVTVKYNATARYTSWTTSSTFTVNQREITVTAETKSKNYGDADPDLTYLVGGDGLVEGDVLSGALANSSNGHVGTWKITQGSLDASSDYVITSFADGDFVVNQRPITVTAAAKSKKYGDADPNLTYLVGGDGLVNDDVLSGALVHTSNGHAGTWAINRGSISASSDYNVTFTGATFTVNKRPITVTAAEKSKKYGEADPDLTYLVGGDGLVNGDELSGALAHTSNGHVGKWAINQGNLDHPDYNVFYLGATFMVNKRPITVTAAAKSKKYGDADPDLTYLVGGDGLVNSDVLSGALAHTSNGQAGTWAINQGNLDNSDYDISFTGATFTVSQRSITITATAATKEYSDADPTLLYTVTGDSLATGDSFSGSLAYTGSLVGTFQIKVGSLGIAPSANSASYTVQYVSSSITITKKTRTGTLTMPNNLASFKVGSTATATASIAIGDGQPVWSAVGACSIVSSTGVMTGNSAGSCTVTVKYDATAKYTSWTTSSTFEVKK